MWWTGGLRREGWGCCPAKKDGGCRLNSWAARLPLASTSRRSVEAPAGCSGQAGGREERAQRKPEGRLAAGGALRGPQRRGSCGGTMKVNFSRVEVSGYNYILHG